MTRPLGWQEGGKMKTWGMLQAEKMKKEFKKATITVTIEIDGCRKCPYLVEDYGLGRPPIVSCGKGAFGSPQEAYDGMPKNKIHVNCPYLWTPREDVNNETNNL